MVELFYGFTEGEAPPEAAFLKRFPRSWFTQVTVIRAKRDARGNPGTPEVHVLAGCLLAPRATADPVDRSDVVSQTAVLYRAAGFVFQSTDRIRVPLGARMAGDWAVDGNPNEWQLGVEVGLVRV